MQIDYIYKTCMRLPKKASMLVFAIFDDFDN